MVRRGLLVTFGILGWGLSLGGALLAGIYSSDNSACGTSIGVTARGLSQTAQNSCVLYGTLWTLGIVVAVVGVVLLAGWVALLVRGGGRARPGEDRRGAAAPGWYDVPGQPGLRGYWDGTGWHVDEPSG